MIHWANVWKAFVLLPGTRRARLLLVAWEFLLWMWPALGATGGILWGERLVWAVAGGLAGGVVSFVCHELFFMAYAERIIGLQEGTTYTPTLERWLGETA